MSETLHHSQTANQDILNLAAMALHAAHDLTDAERTTRSETVIRGTMAFRPTDPAQTILGTLILGHLAAIMDGFRDIACLKLTPAEAARARMVTVAQTKLVLQLLRELRIAQTEAQASTMAEPAQGAAEDGATETTLARFRAAYAATLTTLEKTDTLTPAAAAMAREALTQAVSPSFFAAARDDQAAAPVTGSRARRRAMMKRNGAFKRTH